MAQVPTKALIIYLPERGFDEEKFKVFVQTDSPSLMKRLQQDSVEIEWPLRSRGLQPELGRELHSYFEQGPGYVQRIGLLDEGNDDQQMDEALQFLLQDLGTYRERYPHVDKVFIGGFSQGAALSLYYGATSNNKINGIVCFSGFLPNFSYAHKNMDTPILKIHGTHDEIIDIGVSQQSMSQINFSNLNSKSYNMGHNVVNEQISDFLEFLEKL